jgi:hypothetical protein
MSQLSGARWYRTGLDRWGAVAGIGSVGLLFGTTFFIAGLAHSVIPEAVAGAVVMLVAGVLIFRILRAGMGVTGSHLLIRTVLDPVQAVPWKDVTGFGLAGGKRNRAFSALGRGEQRWSTVGCSPSGLNYQEEELERWRVARALEDMRLAATPGATSKVPSVPPKPFLTSWGDRWSQRLWADAFLVVFLGVAVWFAWASATSVGLAVRAADGGGTPGYFLATSESCHPREGCTWYGDFRLPGGRVVRTDVMLSDAPGDLETGARVAARDVGDNDTFSDGAGAVYPAHDPGAWADAVIRLVLGAGFAAIILMLLLVQVPRGPRPPGRRP